MSEIGNMFAQEIEANGVIKGKALGVAEGAKIVKLFIEKYTPEDISHELGISLDMTINFLQESGLMRKQA